MKNKQINGEYPPLYRGSLFARFFALFFCLSVLGLGNVWGETYTITFKTSSSDGSTTISNTTQVSDVVSVGASYVSGFTNSCSKAYLACVNGIKLGSGSATGTMELNIAASYQSNIKKITIKSAKYGSDTGTLTLYSGSTSLKTGITPGTDYTHTFTTATTVSSIKIATSAKRAYISEVILETAGGGSSSGGTVHDVLTNADFTATGTTYTNFSNVSKNTAVYAGNSAKNNGIQLRSSNSNSGVVSTTSGGKIKSVTVTWNSNTASGRTIDVYGSNTAYTSAADLYNNTKQGTKLGSIVMGTSTSVTATDDYAYVGVRSNNGSLNIDDIDFAWEEGGGGDPDPTCSTPTITFAGGETVSKLTTDAAFTNAASVEYESTATGQAVKWSVEDGKEGVATVNATTGEVTIVGVGEAKIYASVEGNATYCENSAYYTLTVTEAPFEGTIVTMSATETADIKFVTGSSSTTDAIWANSTPLFAKGITLSGSNGSSSSYSYYDGDVVRFYQNNTLTITPATGITIKKVEIVRQTTASSNGGTINCSGLTASNDNTTTNTNVYTGSATSAVTFTAAAQARFTEIKVYYTGTYVEPELIGIEATGTPAEFWKGDAFNHNGITITALWDDENETDVTSLCEFSGYNMSVAGEQTVTVTYKGETATYSIEVKTIANTKETAYTTTQAKTLIDAGKDLASEVYVKGTIDEIVTPWSTDYNNITYGISGFQLFRCVTNGYGVGDDVIAKGTLTKYNSTYELGAGNTIVAAEKKATLSIAEITIANGEDITPVITTNIVGEYLIEYVSDNEEAVLADGDEMVTMGAGVANITATISADGYKSAQTTFKVTVTTSATLESVTINGELENATYTYGDAFSKTGLTANAHYSDGNTVDVTDEATWTYNGYASLNLETVGNVNVDVVATYKTASSEAKTCVVTVNKKASSITIADMEIALADANVTIVATTTPADAALTYTIVSGEEYITLADGKVSAKAAGTAVVKASFAGNDEYEALDKDFNVKVSNILIAKKESFVTGDNSGSHNFTDNTDISFEAFKGNASTDPGFYNSGIRLYQGGGYITIKGTKGVKIQSVELTTTSEFASTTVGYCVDDAAAPTTGVSVAKSSTYTISDLDNQNVSIYCLGTDKYTRLEIASLIVKYTKEVIALDHITLSGTYTTEFVQNSTFNHDGVVVTATYADSEEQVVTSSAVFSTPDLTTTGTKTVTVTYTEGGIEKTASYDITVMAELATKLTLGGEYPTRFSEGDAFSHEGLTVKADYNSGRKNIDVTEAVTVSTPDMLTSGVKTVTVSYTYNENTITEDYTIQVVPASAVFYESFDTNDGTGGNDGQWSGSIASNTLKYDNEGWTCVSTGGANKCAKFGAGNTKGSAQTPAIAVAGDFKLTFKAAAWNSNNEATTLNISATNATVKTTSVTLVKGAWTEYTVYIVNATNGFKVKFEAAQVSNNRFFLDEVMIQGVLIRNLGGQMGTHCYPFTIKAGEYQGASFYVPAYRIGTSKLYWDEVTGDIEAGKPYLIVPDEDATEFVAVKQAETVDAPVAVDYGMVGVYTQTDISNSGYYIVYNNEFRSAGAYVAIGANRACIDLTKVTDHEVAPAPGRRRIEMSNAAQVVTGMENVNDNDNVNKMLINGQLFIIRAGKTFNAAGMLVK